MKFDIYTTSRDSKHSDHFGKTHDEALMILTDCAWFESRAGIWVCGSSLYSAFYAPSTGLTTVYAHYYPGGKSRALYRYKRIKNALNRLEKLSREIGFD